MDSGPFPAPFAALGALGICMLSNYHRGQAVTTPLTRQLRGVGQSTMLPVALVAVGVGFLGLPAATIPEAILAVTCAAAASAVCRGVRWRLQAPVRVVVVGDRAAVATATARWAGTPNFRVVGGMLMEPDLAPDAAPREVLGVPTVVGLDRAARLVERWQADLVLVTPGVGVSAEAFRRLTWALAETRAAVGVTGVLDSVAPHRITPGRIERSAILDVRPPRPSRFVCGLKAAVDRCGGLVLLTLVSPLLLAMAIAVRVDSKGPALFTQTRIGKDGRPFQVYKMRTMVSDADSIKSGLAEQNEYDSVLFKIRRDPRTTRVGHFLRKSSLDELPQLLNVVRGDMSLVGPRPFVPDEVARMDNDSLRRHAVKPGITGLWQVSGRSDLEWGESSALDTYYADNWGLSGDVAIALRTVQAVLKAEGAY
ncbi:MAG TPA: exopolysaccharide biosynthesis polyprenyl glycosylphosphotransferase [Marmoricola sp.]|nr:exopolysaccharide biosynthesis polyprenyl glycosylphosphotransferase [Marmoricola sp.]